MGFNSAFKGLNTGSEKIQTAETIQPNDWVSLRPPHCCTR